MGLRTDGYRIIAAIDGSASLFNSMHGQNYTAKYPHIAEALKRLNLKEAVFDGEVVALDPTPGAEVSNGKRRHYVRSLFRAASRGFMKSLFNANRLRTY